MRQRRVLGIDIDFRNRAKFELATKRAQGLALQRDHVLGARDLRAQPRFLNRRRHDVGSQGQIGRIELKTVRFGLGRERLDRPTIGAEDVGDVGDRHLRRE